MASSLRAWLAGPGRVLPALMESVISYIASCMRITSRAVCAGGWACEGYMLILRKLKLRALLIDLNGTLHVGSTPTPRAVEALRKLRQSRMPLLFW
jgi:hypothetical protein